MKKQIVYLCLILTGLFGIVLCKNNTNYINNFCKFDITDYCFILSNTNINRELFCKEKFLQTGDKIFVYPTTENIKKFFSTNYLYFECIVHNSNINNLQKNLKFKVLKTEQYENKTVYYSYSTQLGKEVYFNGIKINLQIVKMNNSFKIGHPMIYSSY